MISKKVRMVAGVQMLVLGAFASSLAASGQCTQGERKCEGCEEEYLGNWDGKFWYWYGYHGFECDGLTWFHQESWGEMTWELGQYQQICNLAEWDCENWENQH